MVLSLRFMAIHSTPRRVAFPNANTPFPARVPGPHTVLIALVLYVEPEGEVIEVEVNEEVETIDPESSSETYGSGVRLENEIEGIKSEGIRKRLSG